MKRLLVLAAALALTFVAAGCDKKPAPTAATALKECGCPVTCAGTCATCEMEKGAAATALKECGCPLTCAATCATCELEKETAATAAKKPPSGK